MEPLILPGENPTTYCSNQHTALIGRDGGNRTLVNGFGDRSPTTERRPYINLWSPLAESNRGPLPYHGSALPTELSGHTLSYFPKQKSMVPSEGFGPP